MTLKLNTKNKFVVVSDIHGNATCLVEVLDSITNDNSTVIFLGDYLTGGKESKLVIDLLINFDKSHTCVFLLGNHEQNLLEYIKNGDLFKYLSLGGSGVLLSYKERYDNSVYDEFIDNLPPSHINFLNRLKLSYEDSSLFVSHTGKHSPIETYRKDFSDIIITEKFKIFGHYGLKQIIVDNSKGFACIDKIAKDGSRYITTFNYPEMEYQSWKCAQQSVFVHAPG